MTFEAPIFIPSTKKKHDLFTVIGLSMWGIVSVIIIYCVIGNPSDEVYDKILYFVYFFMFAPIVIMFINAYRFEPMNGLIKGTLKVNDSEISYGDKTIKFVDIVEIDFKIDKYVGEYISNIGYRKDVIGPILSQGVGNSAQINTKQDESIFINFRLNDKDEREKLELVIRALTIKGKVHLLRAVSLLQLPYKEVEALKAEIAKGESTEA